MNILYLGDPNSIHDLKWISYFSKKEGVQAFLLARPKHFSQLSPEKISSLERTYRIKLLGAIADYSLIKPWNTRNSLGKLKKHIRQHKIDVFHVFYAEPNALWGRYRKKLGVPMLLTTRGSDILVGLPHFEHSQSFLAKLVFQHYKSALKSFDHITSTSGKQVAKLREYLSHEKDLHLIRTGINTHLMSNREFPLPNPQPTKRFVLFPRNMAPLYRHEFAIKAIQALPSSLKAQYQFVFLQKDSNYHKYVQDIQNRMDALPDTAFCFYPSLSQEELFGLYQKAALVVMTPDSDGSPVSAMETMYFKAPLILPPLPYDQDLFGEVTRYSQWEPEALASTMQQMLTHRNGEQVQKNYDRVIQKADRSTEMDRLFNLYSSSIN